MNKTRKEPAVSETDWVLVGEVAGPFGIRGQVKVRPLMEKPEILARLPRVLLRSPENRENEDRVTEVKYHQDILLLRFAGVPDRNHSEELRNYRLFIPRSDLPSLEEDSFYEDDLLGLQVVTEAGRDLGQIEAVHFYPANDVYETPVALIPAIESVIVRVDLEEGKMLVRDIPGLRKDEQ